MRIAVVHDWPIHFEQEYTWRDGLCAAIKELGKRHEIKFWVEGKENAVIPHPYFPIYVSSNIPAEVQQFNPDVILSWGDTTRPNAAPLSELGKPHALCFAGGAPFGPTAQYYDHFFVESAVYFDEFKAKGASVSRAFGTNTELFQPEPRQNKQFDSIFPATFASWKRHNLFSNAVAGLRACAVGYMQPGDHEDYCYKDCLARGVLTLPHVSAEVLRYLYAASKTCVITSTAQGGSQRTVLEAMAMNVPVIVTKDSDKTTEYVREGGGAIVQPNPAAIYAAILDWRDKQLNTRDYILSKWSEFKYADALEAGLQSLL